MKDLHTVESVNVFQLQTQQAMQKKAKEKEAQRSSNHPGAASRKAKGRTAYENIHPYGIVSGYSVSTYWSVGRQ